MRSTMLCSHHIFKTLTALLSIYTKMVAMQSFRIWNALKMLFRGNFKLCGQSHSQTWDSTGESLGLHIKKSFASKFMWRGPTQPFGNTTYRLRSLQNDLQFEKSQNPICSNEVREHGWGLRRQAGEFLINLSWSLNQFITHFVGLQTLAMES